MFRLAAFLLAILCCVGPSLQAEKKEPPCAMQDTVEIQRFKILPNKTLLDTASKIHYPRGLYFRDANATYRGCVCELKKCIRKCCPVGQHILNGSTVCDERGPSWKNFSTSVFKKLMHSSSPDKMIVKADFEFLLGFQKCGHGSYMLEFEKNLDDNFTLLDNGKLQLIMDTPPDPFSISQYCIEYFEEKNYISAIICFPEEVPLQEAGNIMFTMYPIGMLLSSVFMGITLVVYALLPELRNLHGKCLMCHVACLFLAYLSLSFVQLGTSFFPAWLCTFIPFVIQFTFSAAFFWLNIMCFDICWMFNSVRTISGSSAERERKKLFIYSTYAWGCPLILLVICIIVELTPGLPAFIPKPRFGQVSCWYSPYNDQRAVVLYFYGPISILLITNLVLFVKTAVRVVSLRRGTGIIKRNVDSKSSNENQQNFVLYLKLFIVMGLSWIMEVVAQLARGPTYMWILTDICNTLQGLAIFLIFVWKPKVRNALRKRFSKSSSTTQLSTAAENMRKISSNTKVEELN